GGVVGSPPKTTPAAGRHALRPPTSSSSPTPTRAAASSSSSAAPKTSAKTSAKPAAKPSERTHDASPPAPAETTGSITINSAGPILPEPTRTPGAINPAVTQANIGRTICVSGWTATVRPPSSYTTALKERQLATGYAYRGDTATGDYEEDHLISLELGGSPTAERNLWPEPYAARDGARVKDTIENKLHTLVCDGSLSLAAAQHAIASNWYTAYLTYVGTPSAPAPRRSSTPAPPPPAATANPAGATALCKDGSYSYAAHHQGACSHHGGVAVFYH
ncbi:MAG: DUF3761 domain-containing protein, partial [Jatrophihabitantaceae bacterium]